MNIMNRRGPNIDPCGMPLKTSAQQENIPLTFTLFSISEKVVNPVYYIVTLPYQLAILKHHMLLLS